jgi:NADPH:quinone reductase-like Zn-dependent oxidoreductase
MVSVPSGNLALLPAEIPDEIAAGLPVAYLSAFLALRQAGFRERQSVLAPGVGGSVGNATLKVARALGASQLVSTAGSSAKETAAAADGGLPRQVDVVNLEREASPPGWPGSLLVASTSSLMRSGGPSRARRWAGWRAAAGWW